MRDSQPLLKTPDQPEWVAWAFALGTVACWSTVSSAFKISLEYTTPLRLLWVASLTSALLLSLIGSFNPRWRIGKLSQALGGWQATLWHVLPLALLNPVSYYLILFAAYDRLPGQLAQPLNFTWPIVLLVLQSLLNKTPLSTRQIFALIVSFFGVWWIATQGRPFSLATDYDGIGIALALLSTLFWAVYWLFNTHLIRRYRCNPIALLALAFWFGFLVLTIMVLAELWLDDTADHLLSLHPAALAGGIYVGIFEMGLAFWLWQMALSTTNNPAVLGNIIYITPFGSLLVLSIAVEEVHVSSWLGLVFIILGIILQSLRRKIPLNRPQ